MNPLTKSVVILSTLAAVAIVAPGLPPQVLREALARASAGVIIADPDLLPMITAETDFYVNLRI